MEVPKDQRKALPRPKGTKGGKGSFRPPTPKDENEVARLQKDLRELEERRQTASPDEAGKKGERQEGDIPGPELYRASTRALLKSAGSFSEDSDTEPSTKPTTADVADTAEAAAELEELEGPDPEELQRAAEALAAQQKLREERRLMHFKKQFDKVDAKGKGYLETHRLHEVFNQLGLKFDKFEVNKLIVKYDADNSGTIDFVEFYSMMGELNKKRYQKVFSDFDVDGSGELDAEEVQAAFEILGFEFTMEKLLELMKEYDDSGDGLIQFSEFCEMLDGTLIEEEKVQKIEVVEESPWAATFGVVTPNAVWLEDDMCWGWLMVSQVDVDVDLTPDQRIVGEGIPSRRATGFVRTDGEYFRGVNGGMYMPVGWRSKNNPLRTVHWNMPENESYDGPGGILLGDCVPRHLKIRFTKPTMVGPAERELIMPDASRSVHPTGETESVPTEGKYTHVPYIDEEEQKKFVRVSSPGEKSVTFEDDLDADILSITDGEVPDAAAERDRWVASPEPDQEQDREQTDSPGDKDSRASAGDRDKGSSGDKGSTWNSTGNKDTGGVGRLGRPPSGGQPGKRGPGAKKAGGKDRKGTANSGGKDSAGSGDEGKEKEKDNKALKEDYKLMKMRSRLEDLRAKETHDPLTLMESREMALLIRHIKKAEHDMRVKAEEIERKRAEEAAWQPSGRVAWRFKVAELSDHGLGMRIGVAHVSVEPGVDWNDYGCCNNKTYWWNSFSGNLFVGDVHVPESGSIESMDACSFWAKSRNDPHMGMAFQKGDILTVQLDLEPAELTFRRNGELLPHRICGVWGEVFVGVQMSAEGDSVMLLETVDERKRRVNGRLEEENRLAEEARLIRDQRRKAALAELGLV